ncbi:MAG: PilZ domain-containing protein [Terriglobales bacterium]
MTEEIHSYGYRTPRFPTDFNFTLQTGDRLPALLEAHCCDLSEDGMGAEMAEMLEIGAKVTLILTLPGSSTSMRIAARVVARHFDGYGFAFVFSSQSECDYIQQYLATLR